MRPQLSNDPSSAPANPEPASAQELIDETRSMVDLVLEDPYRPCGVGGDDLDLLPRRPDLLAAFRTRRDDD